MIAGRKVLAPQDGIQYFAFVDMSGGGADDSTLAIAHTNEEGRAVLDCLIDQGARTGGTFSPEEAVKKFADVLKLYHCASVQGDQYAGHWPREAFMKLGIRYELADLNRSQIYSTFEPLLNAGQVELLDIPKLLQQLIGLVRKGIKIDHPTGEHDDLSNSTCGAIIMAKQPQIEPGGFVFLSASERMQQEGFL